MTKTPEQLRQQRYYKKNAAARKAATKKWRHGHPQQWRISTLRARCKKHNLPFNVTVEDLAGDTCPILDLPLSWDGKVSDNAAWVDRIVPHLGYVKGNVRVISSRANRLKNNATLDELERICAYMRGER